MKNWSKKKTLIIGISIIAVCLLVSLIYMVANRTTKREPTQQEIEACTPYAVDWQALGEGTDKEIILSLCTYTEEQTIGSNVYEIYTSDALGDYLYQFGEMTQIALLEDVLYIQYTDSDAKTITLGYSDDGLMEKAVYDPATDVLYYELGDVTEVWEKFGAGIQWGA